MKKYKEGEEPENSLYAVVRKMTSLKVMGKAIELPKGQAFIPVFDKYEDAYNWSEDGKYRILVMEQS